MNPTCDNKPSLFSCCLHTCWLQVYKCCESWGTRGCGEVMHPGGCGPCTLRWPENAGPHRQEGMDNVRFDAAERLVLEHEEDLLFFVQRDEVPKPGPLGQPECEESDAKGSGRRHGGGGGLLSTVPALPLLRLTPERTLASSWTSPPRWGLDGGEGKKAASGQPSSWWPAGGPSWVLFTPQRLAPTLPPPACFF